MPSDIRSFFGGGGGGGGAGGVKAAGSSKPDQPPANPPKKSRARKVVSDDDDEEEEVVKPKKTTTPKKKKPSPAPKEEETTSSAYFASKSKPSTSKSTPIRTKPMSSSNGATSTPSKPANGATPSSGRRSARKTSKKSYAEEDDEDTKAFPDEDEGDRDDIFADNYKSRKAADDYEEGTDDENEVLRPGNRPKKHARAKREQSGDGDSDLEMAEIPAIDGGADSKRKRSTAKTTSKKRKSEDHGDEDEDDFVDDDDEAPKKKSRKTAAKSTPKKPRASTKKAEKEESKEMQDIFASIPTVRAPTPPPRDPESRKFNYQYGGGNASKEPIAAGSKPIPEGADNCLAGLTFVFTGVLDTIGREEGQNLVKRYGGRVTGAPSKKTSYVVLGQEAGARKLETIQSLGIKTINEDGLFELIKRLPPGGGDSKAAEVWAEKQAKEEEKIRKEAEEMERLEKEKERAAAKDVKTASARNRAQMAPKSSGPKVEDRLWVDKYAPDSLTAVCGNKGQVEKLQAWLRNWRRNAHFGFRKAGPDSNGNLRAAMLHGPPGVGKTTAAHLVAKLEGYDVVETNASDTRSKKLMEQSLKGVTDTTSLLGFFAGDGKKVEGGKKNLVLIMDEVDGMSSGDRGGVGALAAVAKKTNIPMILICNERRLPKMKPFDFVTADFPFRRPTTDQIRGRIATIAYREGLRIPPQVMNAIIEGSNADIRQIINMVSTIKLDNKDLDFNDSKAMAKAWEKHVTLKPWDIVSKIMRPQMFSQTSTVSLNEKAELYFNDHDFSFLMLQENYLKSSPSLIGSYEGKERNLKWLELAEKASSSISDGDLIDRMIHGSQQQWSLMPVHAIFSFVKPASYVYGNFNTQVGFASWLGQHSKFGKLSRYVKELQGHMRLRTSADRHEIRQQYFPALWNGTIGRMLHDKKEAVAETIEFMDSYYLTKEDYDAILELGVGSMKMVEDEKYKDILPVVGRLDTQTKATFTRMYNGQSHPMPFVKASAVGGGKAAAAGGKREKPDLEEAFDDDDDDGVAAGEAGTGDGEVEEEDMDLSKDKYVKVPKKKAATKAGGAAGGAGGGVGGKAGGADGKGGGKRKKGGKNVNDEDEDEESEEEKPKNKKASTAGKGRKGKA